jgi:hypothetical protein
MNPKGIWLRGERPTELVAASMKMLLSLNLASPPRATLRSERRSASRAAIQEGRLAFESAPADVDSDELLGRVAALDQE